MKSALTLALFLAITSPNFSQERNKQGGTAAQHQGEEAPLPPQGLTIEEQDGAPVRVALSATRAVPEIKRMVELEFVTQGVPAKPIKAYTIHATETWQDAQTGNGVIKHDMRYPVPSPSGKPHRIVFRTHTYGKVKVWVASVEYDDGSVWKSKLVEVDKENPKPQ